MFFQTLFAGFEVARLSLSVVHLRDELPNDVFIQHRPKQMAPPAPTPSPPPVAERSRCTSRRLDTGVLQFVDLFVNGAVRCQLIPHGRRQTHRMRRKSLKMMVPFNPPRIKTCKQLLPSPETSGRLERCALSPDNWNRSMGDRIHKECTQSVNHSIRPFSMRPCHMDCTLSSRLLRCSVC